MDYSNLFVCLLGMGIVFLGLIMLIALVSVMSNVVNATDKNHAAPTSVPVVKAPAPAAAPAVTPAMVAAISAAIAEASGTDAAALRIVSIKQI